MTDSDYAALEELACNPEQVDLANFNSNCSLPYGLEIEHLQATMNEFIDFVGFIGQQLRTKKIPRLESFLMPANFSSIVGEFATSTLPNHCPTLAKNNYHNGHPDIVPKGKYPGDSVQHDLHGIEVKGSRYLKGWQGHNPEEAWLMVFCFDSSRPTDDAKNIAPKPFEYLAVLGAQLVKEDWTFAGRSATSRRTITAAVNKSGYAKMAANWIYKKPGLKL